MVRSRSLSTWLEDQQMLLTHESNHSGSSTYLPASLDKALRKPLQQNQQHYSSYHHRALSFSSSLHDSDDNLSTDAFSLQMSEITNDVSDLTPQSGGSTLFTPYGCDGGLFDYTNDTTEKNIKSLYSSDDDDHSDADSVESGDSVGSKNSSVNKKAPVNLNLYQDDDEEEDEETSEKKEGMINEEETVTEQIIPEKQQPLYSDEEEGESSNSDDEEEGGEVLTKALSSLNMKDQATSSSCSECQTEDAQDQSVSSDFSCSAITPPIKNSASPSAQNHNHEDEESTEAETTTSRLYGDEDLDEYGEDDSENMYSMARSERMAIEIIPEMASPPLNVHEFPDASTVSSMSLSSTTSSAAPASTSPHRSNHVLAQLEQKRRARAERLMQVKERIRLEKLAQQKAQATAMAAQKKLQQEMEQDPERRKRITFQWYNRCGRPTKATFLKHVQRIEKCEITPLDIEQLPWRSDGSSVDCSAFDFLKSSTSLSV
uniref:Uncharacterized protein n=1 Tax=Entomoneis paludosa TaxID=265537 RepID=A0A7S2YCT8_9STRA|mmetsp:Transcript_27678/g.57940  ORF Transcript_27678/g.57940 Transcript_27678/m.57940 type:complete len:487 (+) Transcript_27678:208-1668(+)